MGRRPAPDDFLYGRRAHRRIWHPGPHPNTLVKEKQMNIDRAVLAFAGVIVLTGLVLAHFHSPWWLLLTDFAGLNMFQAAFTRFCPAAIVFRKLGLKPGNAFV
jgi:hypothetical protein